MVEQLAIVSGKILATVVIHAIGLMLLRQRIIWFELAEMLEGSLTQFSLRGIAVHAYRGNGRRVHAARHRDRALHRALPAARRLPDLHTAVYFSTITYGTVGYDDEGINGIVLLGWSTAFFVSGSEAV